MKIKYIFFTKKSLSTLGSSSLLNLNMIIQMTVNRVWKGLNSWIYSLALQPGLKSSHCSEFTSVTELFGWNGPQEVIWARVPGFIYFSSLFDLRNC